MSSKRLLDFLILASTTKQITTQHIRLRRNQLNLYSQTSSLIKPLRERRVARHAPPQSQYQGVEVQAGVHLDAQNGAREWVQREEKEEEGDGKDIPTTSPSTALGEEGTLGDKAATVQTTTTATVIVPPPLEDTEPAEIIPRPTAKDVDPELSVLRPARGSPPVSSRLREHPKVEEASKIQEKGQEEKKDLGVHALGSEIPPPDNPKGNPSITVPEEPPSTSTAPKSTETPIPASTSSIYMASLPPNEASTMSTTPSPTRPLAELNQTQENNTTPLPPPTITPAELDFTIQSLTTDTPTTESVRPSPHTHPSHD